MLCYYDKLLNSWREKFGTEARHESQPHPDSMTDVEIPVLPSDRVNSRSLWTLWTHFRSVISLAPSPFPPGSMSQSSTCMTSMERVGKHVDLPQETQAVVLWRIYLKQFSCKYCKKKTWNCGSVLWSLFTIPVQISSEFQHFLMSPHANHSLGFLWTYTQKYNNFACVFNYFKTITDCEAFISEGSLVS